MTFQNDLPRSCELRTVLELVLELVCEQAISRIHYTTEPLLGYCSLVIPRTSIEQTAIRGKVRLFDRDHVHSEKN